MIEYNMKRLNELATNFNELENRRTIMKEYGGIESALTGVNENGETTLLHIAHDSLIVETFQHNGWIRKNYYDAEGYADGESYNGKWK